MGYPSLSCLRVCVYDIETFGNFTRITGQVNCIKVQYKKNVLLNNETVRKAKKTDLSGNQKQQINTCYENFL